MVKQQIKNINKRRYTVYLDTITVDRLNNILSELKDLDIPVNLSDVMRHCVKFLFDNKWHEQYIKLQKALKQ